MARAPLRVVIPGLAEGSQMLGAGVAHYMAAVHRLKPGARFLAVDPERGLAAPGVVERVGPGRVFCRIERPSASPEERGTVAVTLVLSLSKGEKVERVLDAACQLGAERVVVVQAERSVVELKPERAKQRLGRYATVLAQAARQSGASRAPELELGPGLEFALERWGSPTAERVGLLLHPEAENLLGAVLGESRARQVTLLIGPEGGFSPAEIARCKLAGFLAVRLGSRVLRTETAAIAALGALAAWRDTREDSP